MSVPCTDYGRRLTTPRSAESKQVEWNLQMRVSHAQFIAEGQRLLHLQRGNKLSGMFELE